MPGRRSLALLFAAAMAAALAPAALAGAAVPSDADRAAGRAKAEHERIVAFWTPERMAAAKPRDFVRQPDGTFRPALEPLLDPVSSQGSSWEAEGDVLKLTGKVYFVMGRSGYVCSGAVAEDGGATVNSLVLTAGHCLYDGAKYSKRNPNAGFATNWLFIPDFDTKPKLNTKSCSSADTVYGCWTAQALVVHRGFASQRTFTATATKYDFGFAVVGPGGKSDEAGDLEGTVGSYPVDVTPDSTPAVGEVLSAFGYPAAAPYDGNNLIYCSGSIVEDANTGNATWGMPCNMTGGSSGGPWLAGVASTGTDGTLSSLNSYKYSGASYMYGPKFNSNTDAVYSYAKETAKSPSPTSKVVG